MVYLFICSFFKKQGFQKTKCSTLPVCDVSNNSVFYCSSVKVDQNLAPFKFQFQKYKEKGLGNPGLCTDSRVLCYAPDLEHPESFSVYCGLSFSACSLYNVTSKGETDGVINLGKSSLGAVYSVIKTKNSF